MDFKIINYSSISRLLYGRLIAAANFVPLARIRNSIKLKSVKSAAACRAYSTLRYLSEKPCNGSSSFVCAKRRNGTEGVKLVFFKSRSPGVGPFFCLYGSSVQQVLVG